MHTKSFFRYLSAIIILFFFISLTFVQAQSFSNNVRRYRTDSGIEFGLWGGNGERYPAPLLFILSNTIEETLGSDYFRQCGNQLAKQYGWLCVSLDLPYHGRYNILKEKEGLQGWANAITRKEDFIRENNERMQEILDHLITRGYVDESNIVVCGTSRGGYLALRFAAIEKKVKTVILFSPVIDFSVLKEFDGIDYDLMVDYQLDSLIPVLSKKRLFFAIGDRDERVDTDKTIELARKISKFSMENQSAGQIDLNVTYEPKGHTTPPITIQRAVNWIMLDYKSSLNVNKWDSLSRSDIYRSRVELFKNLPCSKDEIIFLGNSISFWCEWQEMFGSLKIKNRGIPGDNTYGVLERIDEIANRKPSKIFIMIGINDLSNGIPNRIILNNYERIVDRIKLGSPSTKIYFQTILPTNDILNRRTSIYNNDANIKEINNSLKLLAKKNNLFEVIDLYKSFSDKKGKMKPQYTWDGVHLNYEGYRYWIYLLKRGGYL